MIYSNLESKLIRRLLSAVLILQMLLSTCAVSFAEVDGSVPSEPDSQVAVSADKTSTPDSTVTDKKLTGDELYAELNRQATEKVKAESKAEDAVFNEKVNAKLDEQLKDVNQLDSEGKVKTSTTKEESINTKQPIEQALKIGGTTNDIAQNELYRSIKPEADKQSGALAYKYKLTVPEGRKDMSPKLELQYNSQNVKEGSFFGYGWDINIPFIQRRNVKGTEQMYTRNDYVSSVYGDLAYVSGNNYGPRVDDGSMPYMSFTNNVWIVKDKSGNIYTYGSSTNARQDNANDVSKAFKWMLEKVEDANGNIISYSYYKNQGQIYPDYITYTNTATSTGKYKIVFNRSVRNDQYKDTFRGFDVKTDYKISSIEVQTDGIWSRKYDLISANDSITNKLLLKSIIESSQKLSVVKSYPGTNFEYKIGTNNFTYNSSFNASIDQYMADANISGAGAYSTTTKVSFSTQKNTVVDATSLVFADINGDGLPDGVQSKRCLNNGSCTTSTYTGTDKTYVYINNGSEFTLDTSWDTPRDEYAKDFNAAQGLAPTQVSGHDMKISFDTIKNNLDNSYSTYLLDVNGDGLADGVQSKRCLNDGSCSPSTATTSVKAVYVYINTGAGWNYDPSWSMPMDQFIIDSYTTIGGSGATSTKVSFSTQKNTAIDAVSLILSDVNGDGLPDGIQSGRCLNDGSCTSSPWPGTDKTYVYINTGTGWSLDSSWSMPRDEYAKDFNAAQGLAPTQVSGHDMKISFDTIKNGLDNSLPVQIVDVNGDGLNDLIQSRRCMNDYSCLSPAATTTPKSVYVYMNNGNGWSYDSSWYIPLDQWNIDSYVFSGGGVATTSKVSFSTQKNTSQDATSLMFADVNGDGLVDAIQSRRCLNDYSCTISSKPGTDKTYVYINTGSGWVVDTSWDTPRDEYAKDFNAAQGLAPTQVSGHDMKISFDTAKNTTDNSMAVQVIDINGDGQSDAVQSRRCLNDYSCLSPSATTTPKSLYIYISQAKQLLLDTVTLPTGGKFAINYKTAQEYVTGGIPDNKRPHFAIYTLNTLVSNDGNGNVATTTYNYYGGSYYFNNPTDRKFAGFEKVIETKPDGSKVINYYHQGNASDAGNYEYSDNYSKIGKIYRTDTLNTSGSIVNRQTTKFETSNLSNDRNFVYPVQIINEMDISHSSNTFNWNTTTGDLIDKTEWGTVLASSPLSFSDIGLDSRTTSYVYLTSTTTNVTVPNNIQTKDGNGNKVSEQIFIYDNGTLTKGLVTNISSWVATSTYNNSQKTYNIYGQVVTETDPRGKVVTYTYDAPSLFVATIIKPLGLTSSYIYDYGVQQPTQITDENGRVSKYTYDGFGRLLTEQIPNDSSPTTQIVKNTYNYFDIATGTIKRSIQKISADPTTNYYTLYDGFGREIRNITQSSSASYLAVDSAYDLVGRLTKKSIPFNFSASTSTFTSITAPINYLTTYTYDTLDRPLSIINTVGTTTNFYSGNSILTTDANGKVKSYTKDGLGRLITVTEKLNALDYSTNYEWNALNKLTKIIDAVGNIRNFTYDSEGKRLTAEDLHATGDGTFGTYDYRYDANGNLTQKTTPKGDTVVYTYDDANRILSERLSTDPATSTRISYVYDTCIDGKTRLCYVKNVNGVNYSYTYTPNGKVKSEGIVVPGITGTSTTSYTYNAQQNVKDITHPDLSKTLYNYSFRNLPISIQYKATSTPANIVSGITYNELGQVSTTTLANGINIVNIYDSNKLFRLTNKLSQKTGATTTIQNISYIYDNVGNILSLNDNSNSSTTKSVTYTYDDLYRLTNATASSSGTQLYNASYTYNILGNILSNGPTIFTYSPTASSTINPHAPTQVGSSVLNYDGNGNIINYGTQMNVWDYNNRLASLTVASSTTNYLYNQDGIRVKLSNSSTTSYNLNKYYVKFGTSTTTKNIYLGDTLIATIDNNTPSYILTDHLGSTEKIANSNGAIISQTDYLPYGEVRLQNGGTVQRGYIGEITDPNNLNYLNQRYFNNKNGQFLSQDPVFWELGLTKDGQQVLLNPQAQNSYSYANNNPIVNRDPSGRVVPIVIAAGLGAAGVYAYYDYKANIRPTLNNSNAGLFDKTAAIGMFAVDLTPMGVEGSAAKMAGKESLQLLLPEAKNMMSGAAKVVFKNDSVSLSEHAVKQMTERGFTVQDVERTIQNNKAFEYLQKGKDSMLGYYDATKNYFVAQVKDSKVVSTVIDKVNSRYINNVKSR